jgi:hypothetical protein
LRGAIDTLLEVADAKEISAPDDSFVHDPLRQRALIGGR